MSALSEFDYASGKVLKEDRARQEARVQDR